MGNRFFLVCTTTDESQLFLCLLVSVKLSEARPVRAKGAYTDRSKEGAGFGRSATASAVGYLWIVCRLVSIQLEVRPVLAEGAYANGSEKRIGLWTRFTALAAGFHLGHLLSMQL
jgi:hypothetical protein